MLVYEVIYIYITLGILIVYSMYNNLPNSRLKGTYETPRIEQQVGLYCKKVDFVTWERSVDVEAIITITAYTSWSSEYIRFLIAYGQKYSLF